MADTTNTQGNVIAVSGKVMAVAPDGSSRILQVGDRVVLGERIIIPDGAFIEMRGNNGAMIRIADERNVLLSEEIFSQATVDKTENAIAPLNVQSQAVLAALDQGQDPLQALEATAAGLNGAGADDGGITFVRIARIAESIQSLSVSTENTFSGQTTFLPTTDDPILDTIAPTLSAVLDPSSDSGIVGDGITKDNTPTISGTGEAGNTITVSTPTGETLTTTVKPDGSWSVTPTQPLPEGSNTINIQATDPAGNTTSTTVPVTIDTTAPTLSAKLDPTSDSGTVGDGITNDNTPTISGTGEPGNTVTVTSPTGEVMTTTVKPDGTWTVTPTQPLPDGAANFPVTATDSAGNTTSTSVLVSIDTTPPAATITLDANITPDDVINAAESKQDIAITGSVGGDVKAGDTVTLTVNGKTFTGTVAADKTFSINVPGADLVADSDKTIDASVSTTDAAGNSSTATASEGYSVDITPPTVTAKLDRASDSGTVGDGITNDNTPTISGTGEPGNTITVTSPTGEVMTTTVKPDGTWTVTPTQPLPDGAANFPVTATDPAGNTTSTSVPVTIDTAVPNAGAAPTVTIVEDANNDGYINASEASGPVDLKVAFDGSKVAVGDTVKITANGVTQDVVISAADKANGYVTATTSLPADGSTLNVSAVIVDAAGNSSAPGSDSAIVDTAVPNAGAAPTVTITEDANNDGFINASESNGPVDLKVAFDGSKVAVGDTVKVTANGVTQDVVISAADKANGYVTATTPLPAQDTMLNVSAVIVDAAGNSSAPGTDSAKVDRSDLSGVSVSITEDANNDGVINQSELQGSVGVTVTLPAGAIAGDLLTVSANGNATQAITLTPAQIAAGQVIVELQAPASGSTLNVSAQVTDAAGNQSNVATDSARIDTTPPTLTAKLDPASDSGTVGDGITNDNTPTISGTGEPGNTITVTSPTGEVMTTTVKPDGTWTVTPTQPLPDGAANFPVTATDPAGNTTNSSVPVTIDTTPPTASVTLDANITADDVINATEAGQQIPVTGKVGGDAKAGDTVILTVNGKTFTGTVAADKSFSINVPGADLVADPDKTIDASVTTTDAAGNSTTATSTEGYSVGTPPTLTAQLDPASDSGKQGDGITSDSTPTISGTTTPGASVSVTSPTGEVLTTTAGPDGKWSVTPTQPLPDGAANFPVTATSPAGDVTSTTVPVTIDTAPPTLTAKLDPASDSGTVGDGITNDNTPTISGTGEPGNTITVTSPTGEVMTTTVKPDGTWTVTPTQPLPDGAANFPVTATDPAGNTTSSSVPVTIDTAVPNAGAAPTVTIVEDANNDGYINASEANGPVDLKVAFDGSKVAVGDTVKVTVNGVTQDIVVSAADQANGYVTTTTPLPADGSTLDVSAVIVDAAGNSSLPGSDSAIVDTTALTGLGIQLLEDENNDGYIVSSELKDNDIDVRVTLPAGAAVGDTVTVTGSGNVNQVFTLTAAQLAAGFIDVSFNPTADRTTFVATAQISDAAGNQGGPVQDSATIVVGAPGAPIVVIGEDANNDGYINAAELQGPINASVILPATAKAGDTLQTSVNGVAQAPIVLTAADISNGSVTLPGVANPGEGQTLTVTAQVSNPAGEAGASGSDSAIIDTTPPAATITLDTNITPDDVINAAESKQDIAITGSVGGDVKVGDTVTLTVNGKTFTGTVAADKTFSINVPGADLVADPDKTIDASVSTTDAAGNSSTATASEGYSVDTTAPTVTAKLDPTSDSGTVGDGITNDNTPTISGTGEPGNTITVTSPTGEVMTTTVKPDGTWTVTPTQPLPDGVANFPVTATDPAGNTTSTSVPVTIDTAVPNAGAAPTVTIVEDANNDGYINASEASGPVDLKVAFDGSKVAIGDTVKVTVNGVTQDIVVSAADQANGYVTTTTPLPADGSTLDVSAVIVDAAGSSSAPGSDSAIVDKSAPAFTAKLDPSSDSGTVGDGITNDNTPTISGTGNAGDTISVTMPTGEVLTTIVKPDGSWSVTPTLPLPDGPANLPVTATDPAGNSSSTTVPVTIDTVPPVPTITLNPNLTADDVINALEAAQSVAVTGNVGGDAKVGDIVTISVNGKTFTGTVQADKTFSINVPGADLLAESGKKVDARVDTKDVAGNSGFATASDSYSIDITPPDSSTTGITVSNITADNVINAAEATQSIPVSGKVTGEFKAGDVVTLLVNGNNYQTTVDAAGNYSVNVAGSDLAADTTVDATVAAHDAAGNVGSISTVHTHSVDTTPPVPTITLNPNVTADDVINTTEAGQSIPITGTVGGDAKPGDTVTLTVNNKTFTGVVQAGNTFSISVPGSDLVADSDKTIDARISTTDAAGNVGTASTADSYTVQLNTAPTANADSASVVEAGGIAGNGSYFAGTAVVAGNVLSNDVDNDTGDVLKVGTVNGTSIASSGNTVIAGTYGNLTIAADGSYSYALDNSKSAVNSLAKNSTVTDIFSYQASDKAGLSSSSNLSVSVTGSNDAPVLASAVMTSNASLFANAVTNITDITSKYGTQTVAGTTVIASGQAGAASLSFNGLDGFWIADASVTGANERLNLAFSGKTVYGVQIEWNAQDNQIGGNKETVRLYVNGALYTPDAAYLTSTTTAPFSASVSGSTILGTLTSAGGGNHSGGVYTLYSDTPITSFGLECTTGINGIIAEVRLVEKVEQPSNGVAVSSLMPVVTDVDAGSSVKGYAITQAAADAAGHHWQYSADNGTNWLDMDSAATSTAFFLRPDYLVRWTGVSGTNTSLIAVSVDDTSSASFSNSAVGNLNVTVRGGDTPFSAETATLGGYFAGTAGADTLIGTVGDDYLYGAKGADTMTGGTGKDTFVWHLGDGGTAGNPVRDTITDFNRSEGDVLDLRDLLKNESTSNLTQYLHFTSSGTDTLVQISSAGSFNGSNYATAVDQEVLLKGVAMSSLGSTDSAIITELLKNNLKVDGM